MTNTEYPDKPRVAVGAVVIHREGDRTRFHYVILDLEASYVAGEPQAGDDVLEAGWFGPEQLQALGVNTRTLHLLKIIGFIP